MTRARPEAAPVTLGELGWTFFLLGLTSYGGPAIVARVRETMLRKGWVSEDELAESLAFCQLLPGPIVVQLAAHVGWRRRGGLGAFVSLVTYLLPAFLLMVALSAAYFRFGRLPAVAAALKGLRAATVGIVAMAIVSMGRSTLKDWRGLLIALGATAGFLLHLNVIGLLVGAALVGWALFPRGSAGPSAVNAPARSMSRTWIWAAVILGGFAALIAASGWLAPVYPALGAAMAKINLLAFGGGYTAVALMHNEAVTGHGWVTGPEFVDGLALGQVTPGPVIVTATFIGYRLGGLVGAMFATACVFLPSAVLLVVLAPQFERLRRLGAFNRLIRGLLAGFMGMLFFVLWQVAASGITDPLSFALALGSVVALRFKINPIWVVLGAVAVPLPLLGLRKGRPCTDIISGADLNSQTRSAVRTFCALRPPRWRRLCSECASVPQ